MADDDGCFYIDLRGISQEALDYIRDFLGAARLTAFNVMFDGTFLQAKLSDRWLDWVGCSYGLFKQLSGEGHPGQKWNLETAQIEVLGWEVSNKLALAEALKERGLGKGDMWQLPVSITGPYAAADADAAWQLWKHFEKVCLEFPFLMEYHQREFMTEVRLLAEQQLRGIYVDRERLQVYHDALATRIQLAMDGFLNHALVAPHIAEYNETIRQRWLAKEPPKLTAVGKESARWAAWVTREASLPKFNPNSKDQLGWLLYDKVGNKATKFTEGGKRAVDKKILPSLGEPGQLLNKYNLLVKERSYVAVALEKSERDGLIHPQFNSVGTITGRLSGSGGWNFQQQPKTQGYLECLKARLGFKLIQDDAIALEPTVLAEFSQCKTLLGIYGRNARPDDIYLRVGAGIPALAAEICKYYDPINPTEEGIAAAKKHCKKERNVAKILHLSSSYGAGPVKIQETLALAGMDLSLHEVRKMHQAYWKTFSAVKRWGQRLEMLWANSGGWVPSVSGRPICVAEKLLKDITNRHTQNSGHDILQLYIWHTFRLKEERGVEMYPWLVDNQDEMIWESPEDSAEDARQVLVDALAAANEELGMGVQIKGSPMIANNMAEIKVSE